MTERSAQDGPPAALTAASTEKTGEFGPAPLR
jgi:hypothetical protein